MIKAPTEIPTFWTPATAPAPHDDHARSIIHSCLERIRDWIALSRARRALGNLAGDDRLLRDIDLTPRQAVAEAAKPFWRP